MHDSVNCLWFRPQERLAIFKRFVGEDVDSPWKGLAVEGPKCWTDFKRLKIFEDITYLPKKKTATLEKKTLWFLIVLFLILLEKKDQDAIMSTETPTATPIPHKTPLKTVRKKALLPKKDDVKHVNVDMNLVHHESSFISASKVLKFWWLISRESKYLPNRMAFMEPKGPPCISEVRWGRTP